MCGDIQINPGPIRYPCGVCKKKVAKVQKAVSCDHCECWFHITCANISADHYSYLCEQVDFNWQCSSCLFSYLPYHGVNNETLASSCVFEPSISIPMTSDILASSSNGIRLIHHNVQGLISKSTELCERFHISQSVPTILCCSETWRNDSCPIINISGIVKFYSPVIIRPWSRGFLPGSCLLISSVLCPEQTEICKHVQNNCSVLNIACCFVSSEFHKIAVMSVYRSPTTCPKQALEELHCSFLTLFDHTNLIILLLLEILILIYYLIHI